MATQTYPKTATKATLLEHFFDFVVEAENPHPVLGTRCHLWIGRCGTAGYAQFHDETGHPVEGTRWLWEQKHGPIPEGMLVLHKCDIRSCVNDEHLFLGTYKDNAQDMVNKGRSNHGPRHPRAKLTAEDAVRIKIMMKNGADPVDVAKKFDISPQHARHILRGERWQCLSTEGRVGFQGEGF